MRISTTLENRFFQTPDGRVWTDATYPYAFWESYLHVFDEVQIVGRARPIPEPLPILQPVSGDGVRFTALPYYHGPLEYLRKRKAIQKLLREIFLSQDAALFRLSSPIASMIIPDCVSSGRPYGVEVVADPFDVFAPGANSHPLRPFFRWLFPKRLRFECFHASVYSAVTQHALQRRYPPREHVYHTHYSSIRLSDEAFTTSGRTCFRQDEPVLLFVGGLSQLYKAPHILIDAVALLLKKGLRLRLRIAGEGQHRRELQEQVLRHGIANQVEFLGQLPGPEAVRQELDGADIFVLPSFQEGLPRAALEAMARALPCIGSHVGGFPELLEEEEMVQAGNAQELAQTIERFVKNGDLLQKASERNLHKARAYHAEEVLQRQRLLLETLRDHTKDWIEGANLHFSAEVHTS